MNWAMAAMMIGVSALSNGITFGVYEGVKNKRGNKAGFKGGFVNGAISGAVIGLVPALIMGIGGSQIFQRYLPQPSLKGIPMATANRLMGGCAGCGY
jgi:hypothetical protein